MATTATIPGVSAQPAYRYVFLDSGPLGFATQRPGRSTNGDACIAWVKTLRDAGVKIYATELADYEVRREFTRSGNLSALQRLDNFLVEDVSRYIPITTDAMREAARLWATARNSGKPTASKEALDGDAILAAQVITYCHHLGIPPTEAVIATINVRHLDQFVQAELWQAINPPSGNGA